MRWKCAIYNCQTLRYNDRQLKKQLTVNKNILRKEDEIVQKLDMVLTNAQLVLEDKVISGGMAVHEGVIQDIFTGEAPQAEQTIDCEGKILFPGCIDTHVHFREPSPNEQEDFSTGTRSAAAGGVTCVVDHPIDVPPVLDAASYEKKLDAIAPKAYIDYGLWGGLTEKNLDSLPELWKKGVMAYKAFLCASDPLYPMVRDGALLEAMRRLSRMGAMLGVHAENNDIITYYREHRDPQDPWLSTTHSSMRPVVAELEAISRVILFAEATGAKLHILHMGIHEGADLVREAKKRGVHVTAETCPHYLVLHEGYFEKFGPYAKCCPPLRDKEHAQQLWKSLFDGTIDLVVSDHSP